MTEESNELSTLVAVLRADYDAILDEWLAAQSDEGVRRTELFSEREIRDQSRSVLSAIQDALTGNGEFRLESEDWEPVKDLLKTISQERVDRGGTIEESTRFILTLKQPMFEHLKRHFRSRIEDLLDEIWLSSRIIDQLGMYTMRVFLEERDAVIRRQQAEMMDLSTPVVQVWDGIVALPLIGTLDSERAQMVMENVLEAIVEREALIAIIDITGVPAVDTLVAQHLIKTAAAIRLMGAECVISGISPRIAQTIVHLGVDMPEVVTRGSLESALQYAFQTIGLTVRGK